MNELCQVSSSIFLRHEWTTLGPCRRCGEPFPKIAPPLPGDGLYRVTTDRLCAGFVVEQGKVTQCAPILRKRLEYWRTVAVLAAEAETDAKKVLKPIQIPLL